MNRLTALAIVLFGMSASGAWADDWGNFATISNTLGVNANRLCVGEGLRATDIGCPTYAPYVASSGNVGIGTTSPDYALTISGSTIPFHIYVNGGLGNNLYMRSSGLEHVYGTGADTRYFLASSGAYAGLNSNLQGGALLLGYSSSSYRKVISGGGNGLDGLAFFVKDLATPNVVILRTTGYVGMGTVTPTAELEVSGTISATNFVGDGSGLTGITADSTDRITSDTTQLVVISNTGYISLTQAGANTGWFSPYTGLVTLGVNATGPVSGSQGYFAGNVGIGKNDPAARLDVFYNLRVGADGNLTVYPIASTYGTETMGLQTTIDNSSLSTETFVNAESRYSMVLQPIKGFVGVGISPSVKLEVGGTISATGLVVNGVSITGSGGGAVSNTGALQFSADGAGAFGGDASNLFWDNANKRLGIGTATPEAGLHTVETTLGSVPMFERAGANTDQVWVGARFLATKSSAIGDGFGGGFMFSGRESGGSTNDFAYVGGIRDGADNSGAIAFTTYSLGASGERMRIASGGNVGIGTSNPFNKLDVEGTVADGIGYTRTDAKDARITVGDVSKSWSIASGWATAGDFSLIEEGVSGNRLYVQQGTGNVGIGTSSPGAALEIRKDTAAGTSDVLALSNYGDANGQTRLLFNSYRHAVSNFTQAAIRGTYVAGGLHGGLTFQTANSGVLYDRMFIGHDGHVGIGTTSPAVTLQVSGSAVIGGPSYYLSVEGDSDVSALNPGTSTIGSVLSGATYGHLLFDLKNNDANDSIAMRYSAANNGTTDTIGFVMKGDGKVGIGTKSPKAKFDVVGTISASDAIQVGSSSLSCTAGIPGALKYNAGSIQVCNGSSWTSVGGASALASLTDVAVTNVAGRDYLRYDFASSKWVNISESAVMSTTTILPNWPDAIACSDGSGVGGLGRVLYNRGATSGAVIYQMPIDTSNLSVQFNVNGTYSSNSGLSGYDCINRTIATLYSEGKAFNFIGNADTGGGALGDRITSGTTSVVAVSNTGLIQINTSGVTTGYFDGAGRLVAPGVSITTANGISSTNGYFSGNVGIGTASPVADVDIHGFRLKNDGANVSIHNTTAGATLFYNTIGTNDSSLAYRLHVTASNTMALSVLNNGNVGINATTPKAKLDVAGSISASDAIQVGTSSLSCSSGIAGSMRYSTTNSTLEYCNGNNWSSMGPSATIAFALKQMGANQASLAAADAIAFNTQVSIAGTDITTTGNQIVLAPGHTYEIGASIRGNGTSGTPLMDYRVYDVTHGAYVGLPGNAGMGGSTYTDTPAIAFVAPTVATTYEVRVVGVAGAAPTAIANGSKFYAVKLGGGTGGSGGGASALNDLTDVNTSGAAAGKVLRYDGSSWVVSDSGGAIASLSDVQLTGLSGRDYLRYDAGSSKWVNISESTAMSTTTMLDGWPDAIVCTLTNPNWGPVVFYPFHMPYVGNGKYYYRNINSSTNYDVVFNADKTFSGYQNISAASCNKSIATLYTDGQAFNYIGNNGSGSSSAAAVSGTGALQFSADGAGAFGGDAANLFWNNSTKRLGVGTATPSTLVGMYSADPRLRIVDTDALTSYAEFRQGGPDIATLAQVNPSGNSLVDIHAQPLDGTSSASVRLFRSTSTTGVVSLVLSRGDGTATVDHQFVSGANASSYLAANGGNVGIGTTNPQSALDVSGTIRHSGVVIDLSDRRLKTDIHTLPSSLEELMKLEPVSFRMKASPAQKELGFIAQDMRIVFPDLVVEANDRSKTLALNYVGLIAPMVKGMQELKAANDNLVSKTEYLERQLKAANDNGALLGRKLDVVLDELKELKQANKK